MQYSIFINQAKALEWGLNPQQAILFSFVYTVPSWATDLKQGGNIFYVLSKQKIVDELPLLSDKPDTAYRLLKQLEEKGLIAVSSTSKVTLVRLLSKARQWNVYPENNLGNISDAHRKNIRTTSDKSPTNHNTSNPNTNNINSLDFGLWPNEPNQDLWSDFEKVRKSKRAPVTQRVVDNLGREITKAKAIGMTVDDCMNELLDRGWSTFRFDWVNKKQGFENQQPAFRGQTV